MFVCCVRCVGGGLSDGLIARVGGVVPNVCVKLCVFVCVCGGGGR